MRIRNDPDRTALRSGAVRGVAWAAMQKFGTRAASLLTFIVLARLLEPEDFGLVAISSALIMLVTMLFDLNLTQYVIQQLRLDRKTIDAAFWSGLGLGVLVAAILVAVSPLVGTILGDPRIGTVLAVLAGAVPIASLSAVPQALLRRSLTFDVITKRSLVGIVVSGAVGVSLAVAGAGVWALVAQTYAQNLVSVALFFGVAGWRPKLSWDLRESRAMLRYGMALWGLGLLQFARTRGDELVVGAILGSTLLGIYAVAKRMVLFVIDLFAGVLLHVVPPVLAAAKEDPERVRRGYLAGIGASASLVFPVSMGLAAMSGVLVPLVFGQQWGTAGPVAQIAAVGAAATAVTLFDRGLFLALDLPRVELRNMAVTSILGFCLAAAAAPWGLTVVVVTGTVFAYITLVWRLLVLQRRAGIRIRTMLGILTPIWMAATTAGACAWGVLAATGSWPVVYSLGASALTLGLSYPPLLRLMARGTVRELRNLVPVRLQANVVSRGALSLILGKSRA